MLPEIFRIPFLGWPIHSYGLLIVIGFLLANYLASSEARRRRLPDFVWDLGFVMLLGGVIGGRIWYYVEFYEKDFADRSILAFFEIWKGGLVFYGGAIGGLIGSFLFLRSRKLPMGECMDAIAPFALIGMGFGRLGCFMNGCCFGKVCDRNFLFAWIFPRVNNAAAPSTSPAFESQLSKGLVLASDPAALPVYPTQLFEAASDFLLCGLLCWYLRGPAPRSSGVPLVLILYGIERFSLEFLRGDNLRTFSGLTPAQNLSLVLVGGSGIVYIYLCRIYLRELSGLLPQKK